MVLSFGGCGCGWGLVGRVWLEGCCHGADHELDCDQPDQRLADSQMTKTSSSAGPAGGTMRAMRLLVIEDEIKLAQYLHKGLSENGHVVDLAHDGIEGRRLATGGDYDLVLLDVMLPGVDGFGVLQAIRADGRAGKAGLPVLMLTARDRVEDRVRGLEQGADDYLVKPFAFSELLARVGALLRRRV